MSTRPLRFAFESFPRERPSHAPSAGHALTRLVIDTIRRAGLTGVTVYSYGGRTYVTHADRRYVVERPPPVAFALERS